MKTHTIHNIINLIGLATAVAAVVIIFIHCRKELSYDRHHANASRIYRVTVESNTGATTQHAARVAGSWALDLDDEYPDIELTARLCPFRRAVVTIGESSFYTEQAFSTDSVFFRVFDVTMLSGSVHNALSQPNRVIITRSLAQKYFGTIDAVGREINILHQQLSSPQPFVIDGVMDDFPATSHFHPQLLASHIDVSNRTEWAYTYFLMQRDADIEALRSTIQQKWEHENNSGYSTATLHLQPLTDIHLYSHKAREIEPNGDLRSILLLISGAAIILFVALINYLNLTRVHFIATIKTIKIKMINGATKLIIAREIIVKSLILSTISAAAGVFLAFAIAKLININIFHHSPLVLLAPIIPLILIIPLLSIFPLLTTKISLDTKVSAIRARLYVFPLVLQFSLAAVAITATIVLHRQMNFIGNQHPEAENANMIVISDNPFEAVQRYERFRGELLTDPSILDITAVMEQPGGEILDIFPFEMESVEQKDEQSLNILAHDGNFLEFMNIAPLAGTVHLNYVPTREWEDAAIQLSMLSNTPDADPQRLAELSAIAGNYREQYILNQSALNMLGITDPNHAVGRQFRLVFASLPHLFPKGEIVGVVPDFHYTSLHSKEKPLVIVPRKVFSHNFIIRLAPHRREQAISAIAVAWQRINPEFPFTYSYLTDTYQKVYALEYAQTRVLSLFAIMAMVLASLGVFGMASFNMQRRTKEIGIRKVNGATITQVMVLLNSSFIKWIAIAFAVAVPVSWYAMHLWLISFAYQTPLSWWIFILSGIIVLAIALFTTGVISYRAASQSPVKALKMES
ncbi:MAG: ABC transporter permease [Cytophagaceae bacterium]|nr:ABC transporter permease [Cytophagaceae bacterium]